MKKTFVDSSVIIEFQKGNQKAISIFKKQNIEGNAFYINPIVVSEVAYILKKKLNFTIEQISENLNEFIILPIDNKTIAIAYNYMHLYNMKPNDAIIAATCKQQNISNLITIDNDFEQVCTNNKINIINK